MRRLPHDKVIARLEKSYKGFENSVIESSAEFITINAEEMLTDRNNNKIFDYWAKSGLYEIGVITHLNRWVQRNGWLFQWVNPEVIKLYPLD
jgi:hypothetical protein